MGWAKKQHPVETLVEWVAPLLFAVAAGWAALASGQAKPIAAMMSAIALAVGALAMRIAGRPSGIELPHFEVASIEAEGEGDVLLLDNPLVDPDAELLLEDRLTEVEPDSRVVRLFASDEATPGELVARIADYLGGDRGPVEVPRPPVDRPADASAALHAALANIRASLR